MSAGEEINLRSGRIPVSDAAKACGRRSGWLILSSVAAGRNPARAVSTKGNRSRTGEKVHGPFQGGSLQIACLDVFNQTIRISVNQMCYLYDAAAIRGQNS